MPFARVEIVPEAQQAALDVLRSGWITMGPETAAFERELASYLGARQVVAVSSGTAALEIALRALHLPAGAAVLTPSLTFCGAVAAIVQAGLRPISGGCGRREAAAHAGRRWRPRPAGRAARAPWSSSTWPAIRRTWRNWRRRLGCPRAGSWRTQRTVSVPSCAGFRVGGTSHAACFSFYATKNLPIGEGGAIATDDDELAGQARAMRLHGMSHDAWRRYLPGASWRYDVAELGLKANMTDVQAAIGRAQLACLPGWQLRREQRGRRVRLGPRHRARAHPAAAASPRPARLASVSGARHTRTVRSPVT